MLHLQPLQLQQQLLAMEAMPARPLPMEEAVLQAALSAMVHPQQQQQLPTPLPTATVTRAAAAVQQVEQVEQPGPTEAVQAAAPQCPMVALQVPQWPMEAGHMLSLLLLLLQQHLLAVAGTLHLLLLHLPTLWAIQPTQALPAVEVQLEQQPGVTATSSLLLELEQLAIWPLLPLPFLPSSLLQGQQGEAAAAAAGGAPMVASKQ